MPTPRESVRLAFAPLLVAEAAPPPKAILKLGRDLHDARLDEDFIDASIRTISRGSVYARGILIAATHGPTGHIQKAVEPGVRDANELEARDGHVRKLVGQLKRSTIEWLRFRDELVKFAKLADAELEAREPPKAPTPIKRRRPGPRSKNTQLFAFEASERKKHPTLTDKEVLKRFKVKFPDHPIFEAEDPEGAFRAARSRKRKRGDGT